MTLEQLGVVLVALLPKDGRPRTVAWLADMAAVTHDQVTGALTGEWVDARVRYDQAESAFSFQRELA